MIVVRGASRIPSNANNKVFFGVEVKGEIIARVTEAHCAASRVVLDIVRACLKRYIAAGKHERVIRSQNEVIRTSPLDVGRENVDSRGREGGNNGREPKNESREGNHGE